jgi:hypothetical protein
LPASTIAELCRLEHPMVSRKNVALELRKMNDLRSNTPETHYSLGEVPLVYWLENNERR